MSWAMAVGATVSIVGGLIKGGKAKKAKRKAEAEAKRKAAAINAFQASRQSPMNPYAGVKNMARMVKDLSGKLTNPYANIGVATQAAEFQAEQSDLALANTLDTLQATGASAGGATALANAALKSKKQVSATLEKQEATNSKMQAQGEAKLQQMQMQEGARVQGGKIAAENNFANQQAKGEMFKFNAQEKRDDATLDRLSGQEAQARMDMNNAQQMQNEATSDMISGVGSAVASGIGGGAFSGGGGGGGGGGTVTASTFSSMSGSAGTGGTGYTFNSASDRRLKKNIKKIGKSPSGLNIYSFEYTNKLFGKGTYQGVMSDEIPKSSVKRADDGFDRVDYSTIDVEFKKI